jgi:hypothetical protein
MSPLIQALLDGRVDDVRTLASTQPNLLETPSSSGRTPLEVAAAKGRADLQAALLRAGAQPRGGEARVCALLQSYLAELSADTFAAGWLEDLGFLVWRALTTGEPLGDPELVRPLSNARVAELLYLSGLCGGWATDSEIHVPFDVWHARYASWSERQASLPR